MPEVIRPYIITGHDTRRHFSKYASQTEENLQLFADAFTGTKNINDAKKTAYDEVKIFIDVANNQQLKNLHNLLSLLSVASRDKYKANPEAQKFLNEKKLETFVKKNFGEDNSKNFAAYLLVLCCHKNESDFIKTDTRRVGQLKNVIKNKLSITRSMRIRWGFCSPSPDKFLLEEKNLLENSFAKVFLEEKGAADPLICECCFTAKNQFQFAANLNIMPKEETNGASEVNKAVREAKINEVTIGDLHGNTLRLIHHLLDFNIMGGLLPGDYEKLKEIINNASGIKGKLSEENYKIFVDIINKMELKKDAPFLRLLGDMFADRMSNDRLTAAVLDKMASSKMNYEIIYSNHDAELLQKICWSDQRYSDTLVASDRMSVVHLSQFLYDMSLSREEKQKRINEFKNLINRAYIPKLKLFSYSEKKKTFYCHGLVNKERYESAKAGLFKKYPVSSSGSRSFAQEIELINEKFQEYLKDPNRPVDEWIVSTDLGEVGDKKKIEIVCPQWLTDVIWARKVSKNEKGKKIPLAPPHPDVQCVVHGHTDALETEEYRKWYSSYDSEFGKYCVVDKGHVPVELGFSEVGFSLWPED